MMLPIAWKEREREREEAMEDGTDNHKWWKIAKWFQ